MVGLLRFCGRRVAAVFRQWDEFWFAPLDPTMLGVLRILTGLMLIYTHVIWGLHLDAFFGPNGWQDPALVLLQDAGVQPGFSFWWSVPDELRLHVHLICLAILTCYTLGLFTRVTAWLAFVITVSYANRALNANFGLDQINGLLSFYLAMGPCGAALSLDRWRKLRRDRRRSERTGQEYIPQPVMPAATARLATRLIQVHMCVLYFFAGISKLKGEAWWNGDAVWMALASREYQSADLTWLAWYPWVSYILTPVTVIWELTFFITVWNKSLRPLVLLIGVLVHLGIGAFLGMWTFGLIMIVTYLSFIPPESVEFIGQWWSRRRMSAAGGQASQPQEHWWPQYRNVMFTAWPFAPSDGPHFDRPRVLLVHPGHESRRDLATDLNATGFACQAVESLNAACLQLEQSPVDVMLLVIDETSDPLEVLDFRRLLMRIGAEAPASVTLFVGHQSYDLKHADDHACLFGRPLFEDIRRRLLVVLSERAGSESEIQHLREQAFGQIAFAARRSDK